MRRPSTRYRDWFPPGGYYPDGRRLLRIEGEHADSSLRLVEDCRSLELVLVPVEELASLDLRRVPGPSRQCGRSLAAEPPAAHWVEART